MKEKRAWKINGFIGLLLLLASVCVGFTSTSTILTVAMFGLAFINLNGLTIVHPNNAVVVVFFGRYLGTIIDSVFYFTVPFSSRKSVSLKVRNFNSSTMKVND